MAEKIKIPKKISIGNMLYKVKEKTFPIAWTNFNVFGQINYVRNTIKIKKCKDNRVEEDIFFHEIAHGILKELSFNHPKISVFKDDEKFVQELGLTLRKTFLDLLDKQNNADNCV